jgi:predicted amidohydrolase
MALDGWKEKLFRRYLYWLCRPTRLRRRVASLIDEGGPVPVSVPLVDGSRLRVAALQVKVKLSRDPLHYAAEVHRRVRQASSEGAQLVVFPEYNNLPLLGMLPGVEEMSKNVSDEGAGGERDGRREGSPATDVTVADVIHYIGPVVSPFLDALYSALAAAYRLHLMAGSFLLADGDRVVNRAFLYGPDGRLIGTQDKVHLMPIEMDWGLSAGAEFRLFETGIGRVAAPVCMDATFYETFRILELMEAEVVMIPIANPEPYNYWLALRGIWPRVQECPIYGVKSALVGNVLGFAFTGRAGVFAPAELTPDGSGVLAEVASAEEEGIALAEVDLDALQEFRRNHPWRDSNPRLYARYFPSAYQT